MNNLYISPEELAELTRLAAGMTEEERKAYYELLAKEENDEENRQKS